MTQTPSDPFAEPPSSPVLRTLRRAVAAAPPFAAGAWVTALLAVLGSAALLSGPLVVQQVIDRHLVGAGSVGAIDVAAVLRLGALAGVVGLAGAAANRRAVERMLVATAQGTGVLRVRALDRLHRLALLQLQAERRGALVSRVTGDVDVITSFMGWGGIGFLVGLVRVTAAITAVAVVRWQVAVALVPLLLGYAFVLTQSQRVLERAHDRVRARVSASLGAVGEVVAGLPTLRVHGAEARAQRRVETTVEAQRVAEVRVSALGAVLFSSAELFAAGLTIAALVTGVLLGPEATTVGELVAVLFLVTLLLDPVQTMVETLNEAQSAMAGLRRVLALLDVAPEIGEDATALPQDGPLGVEVRGLSFAYSPEAPVLDEVTVTIAPRSHVAVVGETGSGKTTFVKLLARLLPTPDGTVELGGVPLEQVADATLRGRVAFVPQEVFLFDTSVAENLRYGRPDATDEQLRQVVRDLDLEGWVAGLADGLDTQVGERGGRLSAGERQLVALARAALATPDLLLLDEATSAVDPDLEVRLRHAIDLLGSERTVVTVAHRLATAEAADTVLVFAEGRLVQHGSHTALLTQDGPYARLHADWAAVTTS